LAENSFFDKPENISNMDKTGVQDNKQLDFATTGKESNSANVLRFGEKSENVTAVTCRDAAGQLLTPCSNIQRCQQNTQFWRWHTRGQMCT
jgi:hypothetical protein